MTPFEQAQEDVKSGKLKTPDISTAQGKIPYWGYQLSTHKFQLSIAAKGMIPTRGWKLKPLKQYYGLKGRTAAECLKEFLVIFEKYHQENPS